MSDVGKERFKEEIDRAAVDALLGKGDSSVLDDKKRSKKEHTKVRVQSIRSPSEH
jgi:hypothetical protein